ncbi:Cof-type HAD-IIB family hydrolase [Metamycoplasma neophronis]|uniref:Cof-type HAD-IIB family hydrolase n=1 Tax=Metamycoplasma neophronis TaxID=872983 RepID=A0ABY2YZR0_9BACT|nr:Cof-type HAD-IIB family hydrolase [Metamycoplasma neophronis]TPR53859.1 Cof-type HAD-IIB family hydrolase [Metamycoplasma neophronis]
MLNFKPKAYFTDLDGTLLDKPRTKEMISQENVEYMRFLNDNNIPVIISTGRKNSEFVMNLAKKIHSPYVICQNGGLIVDINNNVLHKVEMKSDVTEKIARLLMKENMFVIFSSGNEVYGNKAKMRTIRPWVKNLVQHSYEDLVVYPNATKVLAFGKASKWATKKLKEKLQKELPELCVDIISKGYALEITTEEATKGAGNTYVAEKLLNIDVKKTVHFGDSGNDISTKDYNGAFIAMKNSMRSVKKAATLVTNSYKKAGVRRAIEKIRLDK